MIFSLSCKEDKSSINGDTSNGINSAETADGHNDTLIATAMLDSGMATGVEQYNVFEASFTAPTGGNPFKDVTLTANFTKGGTTVTVYGFYDGGLYGGGLFEAIWFLSLDSCFQSYCSFQRLSKRS